jgi:hypothetical protein
VRLYLPIIDLSSVQLHTRDNAIESIRRGARNNSMLCIPSSIIFHLLRYYSYICSGDTALQIGHTSDYSSESRYLCLDFLMLILKCIDIEGSWLCLITQCFSG